jgi:glycosyltransferase involved in cell wall biosynthesis
MRGYHPWVVYSAFVKEHVHERIGVGDDDTIVIPPPADTERGEPGPKDQTIVAVGRFFPSTDSNNKKHPLMIDAFKRLGADGWTFHLAGGAFDRADVHRYLEELREQAAGAAIELHPNASVEELDALYRGAALFWHAAGYGETDPEKLEHFGITTVEAMAYGCVPVVPALGGQLEIVTDGVDGRLWHTPDELVSMTRELVDDPDERARLAAAAVPSAQRFSKSEFVRRVRAELFD